MVTVYLGIPMQSGFGMLILHDNSQLSNQVFSNANQAWFDIEHPKVCCDPLFSNLQENPNPQLVESAEIETLPTVLFFENMGNGQVRIVTRLEGANTYQKIKDTFLAILEGQFGEGDGTDPSHQYEGSDLGLGVMDIPFFNLLPAFPPGIYGILAAISAYQASQAKKPAGKLAWGGLAAFSAIAFLKAQKK